MGIVKEVSRSNITVVIKEKESFLESLYKDIVTLSFICFCVYISQGSTWWTFVTGLMFLAFSWIKIGSIIKRTTGVFDNTEDAINHINENYKKPPK